MKRFLRRIGIGVDKANLIMTMKSLILVLHLVSNFWSSIATFNLESSENWMFHAEI